MNLEQKIESFLQKELNSDLKEILVCKCKDGSFELFDEYKIIPQTDGLFKVSLIKLVRDHIFSSLKNAFIWCVFHKYNRFLETKRIEQLDLLLNSLDIILAQQKRLLAKTTDLQQKYIYSTKISEGKIKKNMMLKELNAYINISKHWQSKKFLQILPK